MSEHEARQALQQIFDRFQAKQVVRRGLLGDSNGTVMVANRPGWAYIRYHEDLNRLSLVRYLIQEQLADETPVVVGKQHSDDPYEQVLGVDWVMYAWAPTQSSVMQWATPAIDLEDLSPGKVVPTDPLSLSVDVRAFLYANGDVAVEYGGASFDLTGSVPGVAGHRLALVYIDLGTDALAAEDGAIVAIGVDAVAPAVPENGLPLGVVDLAQADATIVGDAIYQYKILYAAVAGEVPLSSLGDYARGSIIRGGAAEWEAHDASGDGWAIVGDGTDVASDLTPNWKGTHIWTVGDDQGIILEMDAAQSVDAFQIKDSGGNVVSGYDERGIPFADGDTDPTNYFAGADAGRTAATSTETVAVGYLAGSRLTTAYGVTVLGDHAGWGLQDGNDNTGVGESALRSVQSGVENVAVGVSAMRGNGGFGGSDANYCVAVGIVALRNVLNGADHDVAIGYFSGFTLSTGARNIFLGAYSGYRQTVVDDILLVDNRQRADIATELTHSILYGTMAANPEDQQLTINVDALNIGTDADADVVVTFLANSNNGVVTWFEDEDYFQFDDDVLFPDNEAVKFGTGVDMDIFYDGADGNIRTDLVAASDLKVDCGAQKTVELQTVVWDDFVVPSTAVRLTGANPADEVGYKDGMVLSFDDAVDENIYFNIQLPHRYKEGTDVLFHIHWTIKTNGAGGGAENVKWDFTYSASSPAAPAESWPASTPGTATIDVQNDAADDHLIDTIATMTGAGYKISEVIICSLKRDTAVANNYADEVYLVSADVHFEVNTMGSRQELVK